MKLAHDLHIIKLEVVLLNLIHHEDVDLHHVGTEINNYTLLLQKFEFVQNKCIVRDTWLQIFLL